MVANAKVTIGMATRKVTGIATNIMTRPYQTPVASIADIAIVELGCDHDCGKEGSGCRMNCERVTLVSFCVTVIALRSALAQCANGAQHDLTSAANRKPDGGTAEDETLCTASLSAETRYLNLHTTYK